MFWLFVTHVPDILNILGLAFIIEWIFRGFHAFYKHKLRG